MNGTAVMATTAGTMSTAGVAAVLKWVLSGCPQPVPDSVCLTLAALVLIVGHAGYVYAASRMGMKKPADPVPSPAPAAPTQGA